MAHDLTYPNGPEDHAGLIKYADQVAALGRSYRLDIERQAYTNILYYLGKQWMTWDRGLRTLRPLALKKTTPRPVTNKVASIANSAVSRLVAYNPRITYSPVTDAPEDVAAASVADRVYTLAERETQIRFLRPLVAKWLVLTGNVFLVTSYDTTDATGTTFVQSEQCAQCGMVSTPLELQERQGQCPQCEQPGPFALAVNPMDQSPIGESYPRGRLLTEVESVFTTYYDNEVPFIEDSEYFMVSRLRSKDWVERTYGKALADSVEYDQHGDPYSIYYESIAYTATGGDRILGTAGKSDQPRARVRRLWLRPRADVAPAGIYAVLVGKTVVEAGEWPFHDERGDPFLNVVHLQFDQVPGRLLAKSRVDDLIPKQDQRNQIESIIQLHSQRMANAIWLVPRGVGISKISGEQGQILGYDALAGVPAPTRISGDQVPPYLIAWLAQLDADMDSVFGMYEVSRGEAPKGVSAASALMLLDERAQQGQSSLMDNWAVGWMKWGRQMLNIWREHAVEDRTLALGVGRWSLQKFNRADLAGGVDMDVETGIYRPHTGIGRRAAIAQAVQLGFVTPIDPLERYRGLESLGIPELMPDFKADIEHASRRLDLLREGQAPPPPELWENHLVALSVFRRYILSEQFEQDNPLIQERIKAYAGMHFAMMAPPMLGPGQTAPKPSGKEGPSKGTAADSSPDEEQASDEVQGATPDMASGRIGAMP